MQRRKTVKNNTRSKSHKPYETDEEIKVAEQEIQPRHLF